MVCHCIRLDMERLKTLIHDDDSAVSPVIGVILMVAITVILAAVIASFVLGLGDSANDVQPNVQYNTNLDNSSGTYEITVNTADSSANPENFIVSVQGQAGAIEDADNQSAWNGPGAPWYTPGSDMSAGDTFTINLDNQTSGADFGANSDDEVKVQIIFQTDDTSSTVETYTVSAP